MKRTFLFLIILVLFTSFGYAQTVAKNEKPKDKPETLTPSPVEIDEGMQAQLRQLSLEVENTRLKEENARKDTVIKQLELSNLELQLRILYKVPIDYTLKVVEGKIKFVPKDAKPDK